MSIEYDYPIVADALLPLLSSFSDQSLQNLVRCRSSLEMQQRFESLSEQASGGTLTPADERAYLTLTSLSTLVATMQVEAQKLLSARGVDSTTFFANEAAKSDRAEFERVLRSVPDVEPEPHDRLPE